MPRRHARFLDQLCPKTIRGFVMSHSASHPIIGHYNSAVAALVSFRNKHIQIVTRYIVLPAKVKASNSRVSEQGLFASKAPQASDTTEGTALLGTGGAVLVPFLKHARDETKASVIGSPW
jgi:indoleamine 2,3-dioxygenase